MDATCVSKKDFSETLEYLFQEKEISLDCEATGLNVWTGDQLFSIAISDRIYTHYFNFKSYPNLDSEYVLGEAHLKRFKEFFENYRGTVYMFNAKFDLALLLESGIEIETKVVDVMVLARILRNNNLKYSLDECAKRQGMKKDDAVEKYISANHLWEWEDVPGKKGRFKKMFFDRVPLEIMVPYAKTDAKITFKLGVLYTDEILKISSETPDSLPMMKTLLENEIRLTKTCFAMEKIGIKINKSYCEEKLRECEQVISNTLAEIKNITKVDFVDSNKNLKKLFEDLGVKTYEVTDLGNPSFTDTSLRKTKHPLAELILKYREAYKLANTYYRGFLYHADINDVLHTNMKQSGTETGRFSYANPNLQNVPTESDIRKCFIARDNYSFVEMDYKAFEYRMLCEYAQETELAKRIMNGEDIHTVTAQMVGVERHVAKSLNFACIAEGSLVLTNKGLIPIELVTLEHLLWDGVEWVSHDGLIYQGEKEVITLFGLTATEDHNVYTRQGWKIPFGNFSTEQRDQQPMVTEIGGTPIRVSENFEKYPSTWESPKNRGILRSLREKILCRHKQSYHAKIKKLQMPKKQKVFKDFLSSNIFFNEAFFCRPAKVYESQKSTIQKLWWAWDQILIKSRKFFTLGVYKLFKRTNYELGNRPYRQQWGLYAGELAFSSTKSEYNESTKNMLGNLSWTKSSQSTCVAFDASRLPPISSNKSCNTEKIKRGVDGRANTPNKSKAKVYDILNAGPRHRFTVSGILVSNCLYGAGPGRISEMLGISIDEARKFRQKYFQALPKIESFIRTCSDVAKQRGFIFNWLGRRSYIDSDFSYKATNSLIQGSCADIVKLAMNQCADYLKYSKSRMLIQVHDSILFEIHDDEKRVVPKLKEIMENAYQGKNIKMEVDVSDFGKNWAEIS